LSRHIRIIRESDPETEQSAADQSAGGKIPEYIIAKIQRTPEQQSAREQEQQWSINKVLERGFPLAAKLPGCFVSRLIGN
jgi:hypothetical protein